jgi:predicted GNAT superfamily acetyltransferase
MNSSAQPTTENLVIRRCHGVEEMRACVVLQKQVWGFSDLDLVPLRMFVVADKVGGQVIGAYDRDDLIGFAMSVPGIRNGHSYLHSHMLAVHPDCQNAGLGRRIKLFQREDALAHGIELMEWTFDPLEIKNAKLNIQKLGAIVRRYTVNQYGITSSPLQGGLPTDRLIAEWWLDSRRVQTLLNTGATPQFTPDATIRVPAEIYDWKKKPETRDRALSLQSRNREVFLKSFRDGLAVLGYEVDAEGNGKFLLGKWDEGLDYGTAAVGS